MRQCRGAQVVGINCTLALNGFLQSRAEIRTPCGGIGWAQVSEAALLMGSAHFLSVQTSQRVTYPELQVPHLSERLCCMEGSTARSSEPRVLSEIWSKRIVFFFYQSRDGVSSSQMSVKRGSQSFL